MSIYYPIVCTIHFKDKHIDTKIPLRVKMIEMTKYWCPTCETSFSLGDLHKVVNNDRWKELAKKNNGAEMVYITDEKSGKWFPEKLFRSKEKIFCPECFAYRNQLNQTSVGGRRLLKVYCDRSHEYLKIGDMIKEFTTGRWKSGRAYMGRGDTIAMYFSADEEGMIKMFDNLEFWNRIAESRIQDAPKKYKGKHIKVTVNNKVTLPQLEHEFERYVMRKTARGI